MQLVHQHGIERTTLADIANAADVPAGNVYYYFKTKDEVIAAVIEAHAQQIKTTLAFIDAHHRSPKTRLKAFVREFTAQGEIVAQYGCPLGSLCSELDKRAEEPGLGRKPVPGPGPARRARSRLRPARRLRRKRAPRQHHA
jgi:AcrR family transcriptional regulator